MLVFCKVIEVYEWMYFETSLSPKKEEFPDTIPLLENWWYIIILVETIGYSQDT